MKFGVFADLHYAKDKQYGSRNCSLSLKKLDILIDTFNRAGVDFCVCLGDTIDSSRDEQEDIANIEEVKSRLKGLESPIHFCLGNHDLEAMDKQTFLETIKPEGAQPYYSFVQGHILFLVLDGNFKRDGEYRNGNFDWTVSFFDAEQLIWLRQQLSGKGVSKVFAFIHQNLDERMTDGRPDPHVVQNAAQVRESLQRSAKSTTVFQGHDHCGGDRTISGIRYITLRAVVDCTGMEHIPYAVIEVEELETAD